MYKVLMDTIQEFENVKTLARDEMERYKERLVALEKIRLESTEIVTRDNLNDDARQRLDDAEKELGELKKKIAGLQRRIRRELQNNRTRILQVQEQALSSLDSQLKEMHREETELRNILIPEAEKHLQALKDKARQAKKTMREAQTEIAKIHDLDLDGLFQDNISAP